MTTINHLRHPAWPGSLLLANFAAAWGFVLAPIYVIGFGLLLPYALATGSDPRAATVLPLEIPLIGLILALLSRVFTRGSHRTNFGAEFWALWLNVIPMALAAILWGLDRGSWWLRGF